MPAAAKLIHIPVETYREMRATQSVAYDEKFKSWNVYRYDDVLRVLNDHAKFSSEARGGAREKALPSIVGMDPPRHRQLRSLVNQAFTPRVVELLAPRVTAIANELLDRVRPLGRMDLIHD